LKITVWQRNKDILTAYTLQHKTVGFIFCNTSLPEEYWWEVWERDIVYPEHGCAAGIEHSLNAAMDKTEEDLRKKGWYVL